MDIHSLDGTVQAFFAAGLAKSSHSTYETASKRYICFCRDFTLSPFPTNEPLLCYFVATIKTYLSGVRQSQIALGHADPNVSAMPRLRQVLKGVEVTRSMRGAPTRAQLPITPNILRRLIKAWWEEGRGVRDYDRCLLRAVSLSAFFGFCRSGELTVPQTGDYDPAVHLSFRDVACANPEKPNILTLLLRKTKTDQARREVKIILGRTGGELCPVAALLRYLELRGRDPGPLFCWADHTPMTRTRLVQEVRRALRWAGLPEKDFAGHSFRIGAATTASAAGVEDSTIQALGRWKSSAFLRYIRADPLHLAEVARSIARTNM